MTITMLNGCAPRSHSRIYAIIAVKRRTRKIGSPISFLIDEDANAVAQKIGVFIELT